MNKRIILISTVLFLLLSILSCVFAVDENNNNIGSSAVNTIRNAVGGAENVIENAGKGISNTIKAGTNSIENMGNNMANDMTNNNNTNNANANTMNNRSNDSQYNVARTTANNGMNFTDGINNTWIWITLAIIAVVAIALVVYYGNQRNYVDRYHDDDNGK